jgi:hypothetical protein
MRCEVRGKWQLADLQPDPRSFTIRPARGGWNGTTWHSAAEIVVQPDEDGSWKVDLLPSSVLGEYLVDHRGRRFRLVVPERAGVEFSDAATVID